MIPAPVVSHAALAAGLPDRFRYWTGRSGRRYLFSGIGADMVGDFGQAVVIAVRAGRVVWIGEAAELAGVEGDKLSGCGFFVHLLAGDRTARRGIVDDLRPQRFGHLRLAA